MSEAVLITPPKKEIEGVRYPVAQGIARMLENGTRYFGSSGASLTHQAFNPAWDDKGIDKNLAKIGLEGERDTTFMLKKWMEDKPNVVLVDSVHIRGWGKEEIDEETGMIEGGDTDHVMLVGDEVILIDTKRWKSKKAYSIDDDGSVLRSNTSFPGGKVKMEQAMRMWLNYLDGDAQITGIICINAEEVKVFRNRNWYTVTHFRLVEKDRFLELLDEKYAKIEDYDKKRINSTLVAQVAINAVKPYDARQRVFGNSEALKSFK